LPYHNPYFDQQYQRQQKPEPLVGSTPLKKQDRKEINRYHFNAKVIPKHICNYNISRFKRLSLNRFGALCDFSHLLPFGIDVRYNYVADPQIPSRPWCR
jgi:hypothetical protein